MSRPREQWEQEIELSSAQTTRPRRDPRAERDRRARRGEGVAAAMQAAPPRRDPRVQRRGRTARENACATTAPYVSPVVIDAPAYWVVAVPDLDHGRLTAHDRDVLGAARILADAQGGAVVVVDFGADREALAQAGADRVVSMTDPGDSADARVSAVHAVVASLNPRHVILADAMPGGGHVGRCVAARLGEAVAASVCRLEASRAVSRGNGGRSEYHLRPPRFVLLAPEAADPVTGRRHEARAMPAPTFEHDTRVTDEGPISVSPDSVPLDEAELIVSAGSGVTDWQTFHELSAALGAAEGGTRVVCDAGALARERQVGISGTQVAARVYVALGISGAPQHLQGIAQCEGVVAVNTDPHADIMKRADLAVVADVQSTMTALLQRITGRHGDER